MASDSMEALSPNYHAEPLLTVHDSCVMLRMVLASASAMTMVKEIKARYFHWEYFFLVSKVEILEIFVQNHKMYSFQKLVNLPILRYLEWKHPMHSTCVPKIIHILNMYYS